MAAAVSSLHRCFLGGRRPAASSPHIGLTPAKQFFLPFMKTPFYALARLSTASLFTSSVTAGSVEENAALLENPEIELESVAETRFSGAALRNSNSGTPPPSLTEKEKKDIASYAHSLGKKLKSQQVGKSGVTDTVVGALIETLEANELVKIRIRGSCPGELDDVVKQLEETTGSVAVGRIGRTVILYRPSLTKLKAEEEKRKRAHRIQLSRERYAQSRADYGVVLAQGRQPRKSAWYRRANGGGL